MKLGFFWPFSFFMSIWQIKDGFGRFLGTGRFPDTVSGHRMTNFHWKLCTRIYNFSFCCFMLIDLQFQVALQQNQKFREVHWWSELYSFYVYNMYILPFKSAFGCFEGVLVYLACIWLFSRVGLAFFAYDYLATMRHSLDLVQLTNQNGQYFHKSRLATLH